MIVERIYGFAATQPDKSALIHNGIDISYAVFARGIESARAYFAGKTPPVGRTAIILCGDLADAWIYLLSLRVLGVDTVCVTSLDQASDLALKAPAWIVAPQRAPTVLGFTPGPFLGAEMILVPDSVFANVRAPAPPPTASAGPRGGHILYSSGTTGHYKKVYCPSAHEGEQIARNARYRGIDQTSVSHALNYAHWTGVGFKHPSAVWWHGGTVIIDQREDRFARFFERGPSRVVLSPSVARTLVEAHEAAPRPDPALSVDVAGGFLSWELCQRLGRTISPRINVAYAATETSNIAMADVTGRDDLSWMTPAPDREVEIIDAAGAPCAVGESGEIRIRLLACDPTIIWTTRRPRPPASAAAGSTPAIWRCAAPMGGSASWAGRRTC